MGIQSLILDGKRYVLIPEDEFSQMGERQVSAPVNTDTPGTRPAVPFAKAEIARTLVRRREQAGLTQHELATAAGLSVSTLDRFERGADVPSTAVLAKVEAVFIDRGVAR